MATVELKGFQGTFAELRSEFARVDNGEGMECALLDFALQHLASQCRKVTVEIRRWATAVFSGREEFDPDMEELFLRHGPEMCSQAKEVLKSVQARRGHCFDLAGERELSAVIADMSDLIENWVRPKLAVGPSARNRLSLSEEDVGEIRRRVAALPAPQADWEPSDPEQLERFRALRRERTS